MSDNREQTTRKIAPGDLLREVEALNAGGYRIVQIGCTGMDDVYEINYTFDKDYELVNLRLTVGPGVEIPSISGVYWGAFVYENELHDLFGITVTDINIDFKGTFYRTAEKYPLSITRSGGDDPCQNV